MVCLGRWKSGLALLLLVHLLVHPMVHPVTHLASRAHWASGLVAASTQHSLIREVASDPDDVCSLCRVANAFHTALPAPVQGQVQLLAAARRAETSAAPRTVERLQRIPRAPPSSVAL